MIGQGRFRYGIRVGVVGEPGVVRRLAGLRIAIVRVVQGEPLREPSRPASRPAAEVARCERRPALRTRHALGDAFDHLEWAVALRTAPITPIGTRIREVDDADFLTSLAQGEACKEVRVIDLSDARADRRDRRCAQCNGPLKMIEGIAERVACPQCGGTLTAANLGSWS